MLGFQDAVKEQFSFLVDQYGFSCNSSNLYTIKYISEKVYINIYHERISYEIYFEMGLLPEDYNSQLKVSTSDIVEILSGVNENTCYQASNKSNVNLVIEKLANLVKMYAKEALRGSIDYFKEISEIRYKKLQHAFLLQELKIADEKAKKAWDITDYKTVAEIYSQFEKHLSAVQLKMLHYAEKKVSSSITD